MQWLMTHLSFYSKVVTHHQKPIVSLKAAVATREGREPSPVPEDEPDVLTPVSKSKKSATATGSVDKVVSQIEEHLKAAQKQQQELLKPKTEQDAYGLYVSTWLSGLGDMDFDHARTVINDLIAVTSMRARSRVTAHHVPASVTGPKYSPISETDPASPRFWQQRPQPSTSMAASPSESWQPDPRSWKPYSDPTVPMYKTQTREYMGHYHAGKKIVKMPRRQGKPSLPKKNIPTGPEISCHSFQPSSPIN